MNPDDRTTPDDHPVFVDSTGRRGRAVRGLVALWPPVLSFGLIALTLALLQAVGLLRLPFLSDTPPTETLVSADGNADAIAVLNARIQQGEDAVPATTIEDIVEVAGVSITVAPTTPPTTASSTTASTTAPTTPGGVSSTTVISTTATLPTTGSTAPSTAPPTTAPTTTQPPPTSLVVTGPTITFTVPTTTATTAPTTVVTTAPTTVVTTAPTTVVTAPPTTAGPTTAQIAQAATTLRTVVRRGDPASSAGLSPALAAAVCDPANGRRTQADVDAGCIELGF